jgi:serine/threonine protein phosphatase 1
LTERLYAIGDIHGAPDRMLDAIARIEQDGGRDARIVFLGDYVDRGPQSREVIDFLMEGLAKGRNWICLLGNHDRMFSMFMEDYPRTDKHLPVGYHWLHDRIGGVETLESYGIQIAEKERIENIHERALTAVPKEHLSFLDSLHYSHQEGDCLFVHAGIRPGVPLEQQDKNDLIWIRDNFLDDRTEHPFLVVHGHTPVDEATHFGNRVALDTGCGYGKPLMPAVFEGRECWILTDKGRVPLLPIK